MRIPTVPHAISYDIPIHPNDEHSITLGDTFPDPKADPEESLKREDQRRQIRDALKKMKPQERITILLRAAGWTLEEVGRRMGVCRERARQWERDARLVAQGKPRYHNTEKYHAQENRRRNARRKKYATDDGFRLRELKRQEHVDKRRKRA